MYAYYVVCVRSSMSRMSTIATLYIVPPCAVCSRCIVWLMCVILHMHVHVSVIAQDGYPPLIWAARYGHTEVVVELVKAKANLDLQNIVMCTMNKHTHTHSHVVNTALLSIHIDLAGSNIAITSAKNLYTLTAVKLVFMRLCATRLYSNPVKR